ncbi:invasin [Superficieibacter electus]|uniref:Invasin n=1 Tax=Superficieibacter electus TaxID=2022662 RepID=A0A2P5GUI8_9ENTR|nr:YchO/YchP family invasin [Superficieibacter electus]POP47375.1 invasin [Superficieibacter electus]POP50221.1 invasin [Superficieibacter electus]
MSRDYLLLPPVTLLLLLAGGVACAQNAFVQQAQNPLDNNQDGLPDLGLAEPTREGEKSLAEMAKAFGEASMTDNGLDAGEQARIFALGQARDALSSQVNDQLQSWLAPGTNASVELRVNDEGDFTGSHGSWFFPLQDREHRLSWSQFGVTRQEDGLVSNAGIGQRWTAGHWLVGYNTFYDNLLDEHLSRAGLGAEAWGENLRLSANYYEPLQSWHDTSMTLQQRMARGYDVTAAARLPFYQHLNTSLSLEQYFGDSVDLFSNGSGEHNPLAVNLGLDYTPVPLVTLNARHKQGEGGTSQNDVGLKLNYRFGVPLKKQLQASEVAASRSLRGSRYDEVQRSNLPVIESRQRKTLGVYLATPPWDLKPGETVALKIQIRSHYGIKTLEWQGDTQPLSLTPPAQGNSAEGWTIIMPAWDATQGAENRWRLAVTVEDNRGQRVSSNEIVLALTEPLVALKNEGMQ